MREHLIWTGETFAPAHDVQAIRAKAARRTRSDLPAPFVISDDLGPNGLLNHADNRVYTSKAEYVRAVKAAGCEIVGNDRLPPPPPKKRFKLTDDMRREVRQKVQALDSPQRKLIEKRRKRNG